MEGQNDQLNEKQTMSVEENIKENDHENDPDYGERDHSPNGLSQLWSLFEIFR